MSDEYVDVVDKNDRPTGKRVLRSQAQPPIRWVNLFVRDAKARFWVPTRREDLERWPGAPDIMGGAVLAGQSYWEALREEAHDELGLSIDELAVTRQIAYLDPRKAAAAGFPLSGFMGVWELVVDPDKFTLSHSDCFSGGNWYPDRESLLQMLDKAPDCKDDFRTLVQLCYGEHGVNLDSLRPNRFL